ncbi:MAG: response regulator transcription factor [Fulvivirga sp.]|uniref:response regulator transcription factor n=1 Tax=Fulvivirga sp. TaxID=1931237 RepID=UPI0032ED4C14
MKTILLIDDHELIRDAIKYYFSDDADYVVKNEATNGEEALELLKNNSYDILICDINMPKMDGMELMENIKRNYPDQKVLVLSMHGDASAINKMISLGAHGYTLKNSTKQEIKTAINQILNGENYFSKDVYEAIINRIAKKNPKKRISLEIELSSREREVLKLIIAEFSNQEIADQLFISIRTVETHKRNLLDKTGCKNIVGLVMYAVERDLVGSNAP